MTRSMTFRGGVRLRGALATAVLCLAATGPRLLAAEPVPGPTPTTIVVHVFDATGLAGRDLEEASRVASEILRAGGVEVRWVACHGAAGRDDRCRQPLRTNESVLRLIPSTSDMTSEPASLGVTVLDTAGRRAVLSTVYAERVRLVAQRAQVDEAQLVGRAMAHELGHLLLGTAGHGSAGLMRGFWPDEMLRSQSPRDWRLLPSEMDAIRRGRTAGPEFDVAGGS